MRTYFKSETVFALMLLGVGPSEGQSQTSRFEPSATEVAVSLRTKGHAGAARAVLTQAYGPRAQQLLDELADTLVAIATTFPGNDFRGNATRMEALLSLSGAGQGENGIVGQNRALPYGGAMSRLMSIAETAQEGGIRAAALAGLKFQPNRAACLAFFEQFAKSQNEVAWVAVHMLGNETAAEGKAIARRLFLQGSVSEPTAKLTLSGIAHGNGWR